MKIILFDIDHTLLNTTVMAYNLSNMIVQETGLNLEEVESYTDKYSDKLDHVTYFDFVELIETLPVNMEVKRNITTQYLSNSKIYTKYPNVDEVLGKLHKRGHKLGIFSEGTPQFRENKLKNLQINGFLDKDLIFIAQSKRSEEYINSLPSSVIIDDNIDVCNMLVKYKKHRVIHLNRKGKKFTPEKDTAVHKSVSSVNSLKELLNIL